MCIRDSALVESALPAANVYIRTSSAGSSLPKRIVNPFCNPWFISPNIPRLANWNLPDGPVTMPVSKSRTNLNGCALGYIHSKAKVDS